MRGAAAGARGAALRRWLLIGLSPETARVFADQTPPFASPHASISSPSQQLPPNLTHLPGLPLLSPLYTIAFQAGCPPKTGGIVAGRTGEGFDEGNRGGGRGWEWGGIGGISVAEPRRGASDPNSTASAHHFRTPAVHAHWAQPVSNRGGGRGERAPRLSGFRVGGNRALGGKGGSLCVHVTLTGRSDTGLGLGGKYRTPRDPPSHAPCLMPSAFSPAFDWHSLGLFTPGNSQPVDSL